MWNKLMGRIAEFRRTKHMLGDIQLTFACGLAVLICEETNIPANSHNIDVIGHNINATATEGPLAARNEIID